MEDSIKIFKEIPTCPFCSYPMTYGGVNWELCSMLGKVVATWDCKDCKDNQTKPLKLIIERKELTDLFSEVRMSSLKNDYTNVLNVIESFMNNHLRPKDIGENKVSKENQFKYLGSKEKWLNQLKE